MDADGPKTDSGEGKDPHLPEGNHQGTVRDFGGFYKSTLIR